MPQDPFRIRNTSTEDFPAITRLSRIIYPRDKPWEADQLASHLNVFPQGQWVAEDSHGSVIGMAASLIVWWDDYDHLDDWDAFTEEGYFTNHDPVNGKTLYAAEVMVDPHARGQGVGKALYQARRDLVYQLNLSRIRAGARLRGYGRFADSMDAVTYVRKVVNREIHDATLSFQLSQGFNVISVVQRYLADDPESRGWAALIEWLNPRGQT